MEIESVETEVYGLFNELNSNDEFDVTCTEEVFVGSLLPKRVYMADYLRKEQARNAGGSQTSLDVNGLGIEMQLSLDAVEREVRHKTIAMEAEMLRLAEENQSFANALLRLTELMGLL